jgi:hypothetical protein
MAQIRMRADALIGANHFDPQSVRNISDEVTTRWQNLVSFAEERHRLAQAAVRFFKTAEHVSYFLSYKSASQLPSDFVSFCNRYFI